MRTEAEKATDQNPYAPTQSHASFSETTPRTSLSAPFWLALAGLSLVCLVSAVAIPGIGIVLLLAIVPAAIRVPLVQRRITSRGEAVPVPNGARLLATSWGLMLAFSFTSLVAFFMSCFPAGYLLNNVSILRVNVTFSMICAVSGLFALAVFVVQFVLSLRMHK